MSNPDQTLSLLQEEKEKWKELELDFCLPSPKIPADSKWPSAPLQLSISVPGQ